MRTRWPLALPVDTCRARRLLASLTQKLDRPLGRSPGAAPAERLGEAGDGRLG